MAEIKSHAWIKKHSKNTYPISNAINMDVMKKMNAEHGTDLDKLRKDLKDQIYNETAGTYYILLKQQHDN